ncbi:uncharacterized protein LOC125009763 [Mugil cephalus]|uniref:uncharacterized protein LOC125009763 n=1 Tax=Mugil cephalus TaxID=48193 RepID=UPI001FB658F3|nr:uncharacterized protein LOC125009763 [Mugil cephalus]
MLISSTFWNGKREEDEMTVSEKPEPNTLPLIVVKKSVPRIRPVKPKETTKGTLSNSRSTRVKGMTTCETSGNIMKLCVNLMPILALAKEEEEEEEEEEDRSISFMDQTATENSSKIDPSADEKHKSTDSDSGLTSEKTTEAKQSQTPRVVLPPVSQPKPASEWRDRQEIQRCQKPLPPITLRHQETTNTSPNFTTGSCGDNGPVTGQVLDSRPWRDNPLFSKSRSAEFRLPDISLCSLDALLQTVTQKLGKKRRGGDKALRRRTQADRVFVSVSEHRFRQTSVWQQDGNMDNMYGRFGPFTRVIHQSFIHEYTDQPQP